MELIVTGISIVALIMAMGARKRLRRLEDRIAGHRRPGGPTHHAHNRCTIR
jgi:hypothetical protein